MPTTLDFGLILDFLDGLSQNNQKAWFEAHRSDYETARETFFRFVDGLIDEFRVSDQLGGLSAKDCVPRIYRDIRFSKDKSPYRTNMGAVIAPGGWRSTRFGYYISIAPQAQSMVAGGLHQPAPEQLNRFRQAIDQKADAFKNITRTRAFVETFGAVEGERLKTAPQGYDRAHPEIALLKLKQVTVVHRFSDPDVLARDFPGQVIKACRVMRPFLDYLERVAG